MHRYVNKSVYYNVEQEIQQTDRVTYYKVKLVGKDKYKLAKTLRFSENQSHVRLFENEVTLLKNLHHPNILEFYGHYGKGNDYTILTEYPERGSLNDFLRNNPGRLSQNQFFSFAKQAASAVEYAHSVNIFHQDIRSHNFFLFTDNNGGIVLKLSEFSYAKQSVRTITLKSTKNENIQYGWQPPEVLTQNEVSKASDIYSFHIFLWELITKQVPFEGREVFDTMSAIERGDRPIIPNDCSEALRTLLESGWVAEREERPSIQEVNNRLDDLDRQGIYRTLPSMENVEGASGI